MLRYYNENNITANSPDIISSDLDILLIAFICVVTIVLLYICIITLSDICDDINQYVTQIITSYNKIIGENDEMVMLYKDTYLKKLKSNTNTSINTQLQHSPMYTKTYSKNNSHSPSTSTSTSTSTSNIKKRYNIHDSDFTVPSITTTSHANNTNDYDTSSEGSRASPLPRTSKTPIFHKDHFNV